MADKVKIAVYMDATLYKRMEKKRGLVKRSTYIENLVKEKLNREVE